jgi:hypothetical protein
MVGTVVGFGHGRIGPGPGFDGIEEVTCVDQGIGFLLDDLIYRFLGNCHRPAFHFTL